MNFYRLSELDTCYRAISSRQLAPFVCFLLLQMGAGQSTSQAHPPTRALHVLRVTPLSPASETSIEPLFDFVVGFEGDTSLSNIDASQLEKIVEQHEGRTLNLLVWSSKSKETRGGHSVIYQ